MSDFLQLVSSISSSAWQAPVSGRAGLSRATRMHLSETPSSAWRDAVEDRLETLIRLETGWDGYGGLPVSFANAVFALRMLESTCGAHTQPPQIVPGAGGDLQVEWHTTSGDLELHVLAPNEVRATYECVAAGETVELDLTNDFTVVANWVQDITELRIAARAAAA